MSRNVAESTIVSDKGLEGLLLYCEEQLLFGSLSYKSKVRSFLTTFETILNGLSMIGSCTTIRAKPKATEGRHHQADYEWVSKRVRLLRLARLRKSTTHLPQCPLQAAVAVSCPRFSQTPINGSIVCRSSETVWDKVSSKKINFYILTECQ